MATEQFIRSIYLTLLHSLWQGAAIAGIAGIAMILSKKSSAASRYNVLAGCMAFFILCAAATFCIYSGEGQNFSSQAGDSSDSTPMSRAYISVGLADQLFSALSLQSHKIVLLWFLILCLKSIQLYLGLCRISDLKTKQITGPGPYWSDRINVLARRLGINYAIKLAESGLTSIPLTVGHMKPVILVPAGMLAAIPVDQIESILLHELAHIKRKDYFINILQTLVEALFFFNPAIWWLSSLLRAERENCCDDIAIANSSSKTNYVRALVAFEEYRQQMPQLAVAFTGNENTLLKRTKRIIYNQNNTLNSMEKFILTSGLVVSGLLSLAFTDGAKEKISKTLKPVVSTISGTLPTVEKAFKAFADTIPAASIREISINNGGLTTFNAVHKGKTYKIQMKDDQVTDLYVDDTRIAREKIGDYTDTIIEIVEFSESMKASADDAKRKASHSRIQAEKQREAAEASRSASEQRRLASIGRRDNFHAVHAVHQGSRASSFSATGDTIPPRVPKIPKAPRAPKAAPGAPPRPPLTKPSKPLREIKIAPAKDGKKQLIEVRPAREVQPESSQKVEAQPSPGARPVIKRIPKVDRAIDVQPVPTPAKTNVTAPDGPPMGYSPKSLGSGRSTSTLVSRTDHRINKPNKFAEEMNNALMKEGLVKDPQKFSYKISNTELIVDGVKQDGSTHSRIISKFIKSEKDIIEFSYTRN